jgi:hypothetical protein
MPEDVRAKISGTMQKSLTDRAESAVVKLCLDCSNTEQQIFFLQKLVAFAHVKEHALKG